MTDRVFGSADGADGADGTDRGVHGADGADRGVGGPLADEALRLVSSVQDWAQGLAQGWAQRSLAAQAERQTGSDCHWCPLCQFVSVMRGERPEVADLVAERVGEAGSLLAAALRALTEAASGAPGPGGAAGPGGAGGPDGAAGPHSYGPRPAPRVHKINLGDEA